MKLTASVWGWAHGAADPMGILYLPYRSQFCTGLSPSRSDLSRTYLMKDKDHGVVRRAKPPVMSCRNEEGATNERGVQTADGGQRQLSAVYPAKKQAQKKNKKTAADNAAVAITTATATTTTKTTTITTATHHYHDNNDDDDDDDNRVHCHKHTDGERGEDVKSETEFEEQ